MSFKFVTATDLEQFSDRRESAGLLPLLIRRLIHASVSKIQNIRFPSGDSIHQGGWDGLLESLEQHTFVPQGISCWEMSCQERGIKGKADEDYSKRTNNPQGIDLSQTTFIFVYSRRWQGKEQWRQEKLTEGHWHDIRVYDADDIEQWLEWFPPVSQWFLSQVQNSPVETQTIESFWAAWSTLKQFQMPEGLVLVDRDKEVSDLQNWLQNASGGVRFVKGDTKDEAIAFLSAFILSQDEPIKTHYLSKAIIVDDLTTLNLFLSSREPLFIILNHSGLSRIDHLRGSHHSVFIPLSWDERQVREGGVLPKISAISFEEALQKNGFSTDKARAIRRSCGRSLTILRRIEGTEIEKPLWSNPEHSRCIIPFLLLGGWDETSDGDKEIVEKLSGQTYDEYTNSLLRWLNCPDSPIVKIGSIYKLNAHLDKWFLLAQFLTEQDLTRFIEVIQIVLSEVHPKFDLEPGERYMAAIHGKTSKYSEHLKDGLETTLILFGVYPSEASLVTSLWKIDQVIHELLEFAFTKGTYLCSIASRFEAFSEAAPDGFMAAFEKGLSSNNSVFESLFVSEGLFGGGSYHCHLLWALEGLASEPQYLSRSVLILAEMATTDPGGNTHNRPINSLREIFLPWHPGTHATVEERLSAIDLLLERNPAVAWNVLMGIMPQTHDTAFPTHKFRWRTYSNEREESVTNIEYFSYLKPLMDRVVLHVNDRDTAKRWQAVLENIHNFLPEHRNELFQKFNDAIAQNNWDQPDKLLLRQSIRDLLNKHRSFPDAQWSLPIEETEQYEPLYNQLEPDDVQDKYAWLFAHGVRLPSGDSRSEDFEEGLRQVAIKQIEAAHVLLEQLDQAEWNEFINSIENPSALGWAIGGALAEKNYEIDFIKFFSGGEGAHYRVLGSGLIGKYIHDKGVEEISHLVQTAKSEHWPNDLCLNLFLSLPKNIETWKHLESFNQGTQDKYWQEMDGYIFRSPMEELEYAVLHLLAVNRPVSALRALGRNYKSELPSKLIIHCMEEVPKHGEEPLGRDQMDGFYVEELFKCLDKYANVESSNIANLEWVYFPLLEHTGRGHKHLNQLVLDDPKFFVELLTYCYKPNNEEDNQEDNFSDEEKQHRKNLAERSWKLLRSIKLDDKNADEAKLFHWVEHVRQLAEGADRPEVADSKIGNILGNLPKIDGEEWPPLPIRNLLEKVSSENIEQGFLTGVFNARGTTCRSVGEGGKQERELASFYNQLASDYSSRWPRVSALMSRLAQRYIRDAEHEDREAELRQSEY